MNTGSKDANGKTIYTVADQKQPARLEFKTKLQTDNTYYLQAPYSLRKSKGVIGIQLNDRWYRYTQSYDETQLWNIASRQKMRTSNSRLISTLTKPIKKRLIRV